MKILLLNPKTSSEPECSIIFDVEQIENHILTKWGIEYVNSVSEGTGLNFWRNEKTIGIPQKGTYKPVLFLANDNNVGIGKKDPKAKLDVNGDVSVNSGINTLSLGSAAGQNLSYGTSYIGFNAVRKGGNWTLAGDGANNGGSVIWGAVDGSILFASIPRTSGNSRMLTDAQIKDNIKLYLKPNGVLKAKEVEVSLAGWPDYVFDKDYKLPTLSEVEQFIAENNHLPNVPSAAEVEANGIQLGEMNAILIRKVEELTLYILDLQKQIDELKNSKP